MINALDLGFVREPGKEAGLKNAALLTQREKRFTDVLCFPPGEYDWLGPALLPPQFGPPPIKGVGHTGTARPTGDPSAAVYTRFTQLDGVSPILDVPNSHQQISGIEFRSRHYEGDSTGEGPQDGSRAKSAIVFRKDYIPTGHARITDCLFTDFETAIVTTGTNNCDNSLVDNCVFHNCDWAFQSENPQTVNWHFRDCHIFFWGGKGLRPLGIANMIRGGDCRFDFTADAPQLTCLQVRDYSPNTSDFKVRVRWDQVPGAAKDAGKGKNYLTVFRYEGDVDVQHKRWLLDARVSVNNWESDPKPVISKYAATSGLPTDGIKVEVVRGAK